MHRRPRSADLRFSAGEGIHRGVEQVVLHGPLGDARRRRGRSPRRSTAPTWTGTSSSCRPWGSRASTPSSSTCRSTPGCTAECRASSGTCRTTASTRSPGSSPPTRRRRSTRRRTSARRTTGSSPTATNTLRMCEGLTGVENFIVMPTSTYYQTEPVTDDTIKVVADLWNRVGKLTLEQGMKTTCHFEFWGAIRTREQLDTFFRYTDPEYVYFFCDTAQHTIAGVDPVQLFRDYTDRCTGFHFKDTKNVDEHEAYRTPPDPELMAPQVTRWFYEMGEGGLVDFPALMKEIVARGYDGWLTVEHDKAELGGGSYAEATAVAKWYIDNVLAEARGRGRGRAGERTMRDTLRWAYALNQWNVRLDVFVRHEDQQRALKTVSACGFDTIELASGTGRWDNISRPEVILLNHGSHEGFLDFLRRAKVQGVSSMFWDPQALTEEEEGYAFRSTANPADSDAIVEWSQAVRRLRRRRRRRAARRPPGRLGLDDARRWTPTASRSSARCGTAIGELTSAAGIGLALHYDCLGAVHTADELRGLLGGDRPGDRRVRARHRGADGRRHRPGGLLPRERRAGHPRAPQGHPLRRHRRGVPDARCRGDDAQGRRRTADRALVLRARHRGRPRRRPGLRRARCGSTTTPAGSSSRATTAATRRSWPCSTAGTCSTNWGSRSDRAERAHQVVLHGPLAQQRPGRADRPVALAEDHVGLPQADQGDRVRRDRHVRLPHLADVRRLRRPGQVPGDGAGPRPGADRQHVPRRRLRRPQLRAAPAGDAREHPRGLPRHDGPLVGDRARQHHRDAGDALLRHGADHRGQAQVHRGVLEQGRRDHRRLRGEAHLPPRVLLRHPERGRHRHVLRLHRPAVREPVRRHRAALHRRPRPGGAVQPARATG